MIEMLMVSTNDYPVTYQTLGPLDSPISEIVVDSDDNVYALEGKQNSTDSIRKISSSGVEIWGVEQGGGRSLILDSNEKLYIGRTSLSIEKRNSLDGTEVTENGWPYQYEPHIYSSIYNMTIDAYGSIYYRNLGGDNEEDKVVKVSSDGYEVTSENWPIVQTYNREFHDLGADHTNDHIYMLDYDTARKFNLDGSEIVDSNWPIVFSSIVNGITVDSNTQSIYVARDHYIYKYFFDGTLDWSYISNDFNERFITIALDDSGYLYAGANYTSVGADDSIVRKISPSGSEVTTENWPHIHPAKTNSLVCSNTYVFGGFGYVDSPQGDQAVKKFSSDGTLQWEFV